MSLLDSLKKSFLVSFSKELDNYIEQKVLQNLLDKKLDLEIKNEKDNITDTIDSTTENKKGLTVVNGINNLDGYIKIPANTVLQAGAMLQFQQGVNEYYSLGCALNPYNVPDDNCLKLSKTITNYIYGAGYVIWKTPEIGNANPTISGDVSKKGENIRVRFNGNGKIEIFDNVAMTGTPVIILQIDNYF